ncbi:DUF397 domain-containing protein [Streptomyces clavuligerus]|uniref:Regulatory protein n=1 Tax=Streptomyces clavuligerus TaxID=1901 RepID=B5GPF8_STRCL|nr:DUF397 domain-containing protein [Streptomyces clavuligerus]AXU14257.1 DUF397 domain-containing protein [Streptomyces clavuligerus]EDY48204.1 hypothetical protein SSCG_01485 [Streptomyces clavuligerus]EFG07527.1 regulatory protein [Streptomyces clavuligerus]MBY6304259.1 DUF397 domain-containing protein [Streptomyces clavuligerus]QCS07031.1 DUF397 domain-containing protein [Streptomyces clavuligerus]
MEQSKPQWFKSSYSASPQNECVECAMNVPQLVLVRDSKVPGGPVLGLAHGSWTTFTDAVREGVLHQRRS